MTQAASGIDLFIPEVYDIVWSLIILVIVAVFFYKFFMPKFNAIFDERAAKIQGNIAKAEQARKDARSPHPHSARSNPSTSRPSSRSRARSAHLPPPWPARSSVPSWKTTTCSPR